MPDQDALKSAVAAGILSQEQAGKLAAHLASRAVGDDAPALATEDERFRLFTGFNDVFLALGVALVSAACFSQWNGFGPAPSLLPLILGAILAWAFAELLVGRHRALLPGIVACASFALFVGMLAYHVLPAVVGYPPLHNASAADNWRRIAAPWTFAMMGSFAAAAAFYARFRFPFATLVGGLTAAAAVISAAQLFFGPEATPVYALALAAGLGLFALAMRFDASDTERATRRSDCGFWLHLSAAPFIVYPLITLTTGGLQKEGAGNALTVLAVTALFALVALIVDRRALLVSSLLSIGVAIGYLIKTAAIPADSAFTVTLGTLGVLVVVMGLGWHRLRNAVLAPFASNPFLKCLPPVTP